MSTQLIIDNFGTKRIILGSKIWPIWVFFATYVPILCLQMGIGMTYCLFGDDQYACSTSGAVAYLSCAVCTQGSKITTYEAVFSRMLNSLCILFKMVFIKVKGKCVCRLLSHQSTLNYKNCSSN